MRRVTEVVMKGKPGMQEGLDSRIMAIQMLIPLGLHAVNEELQAEVERLVGPSYSRTGGANRRWGSNPGSVCLGDQKVSVDVPRVRDTKRGREIPLESYVGLQEPQVLNETVLVRVLNGLSQRKYEKVATMIPETFGIKHSSVSRRFIKATKSKLKAVLERDLRGEQIVAIFIDGKRFAENGVIIALGVRLDGTKLVLGFIESSRENHRVCGDFVKNLVERGLKVDDGILFVIDGSKGLYKGIKDALGANAFIQRCQWHKRENVLQYLDKKHHTYFRTKLQKAYEEATYEEAKKQLLAIRRELSLLNESAVTSLDEGLEETLTLHKLGMFKKLSRSFKTTNCLESVNNQLGQYTDRACRWRNSNMRQRWVASALLEIEPTLRKVNGYQHLKELRDVMKSRLVKENAQVKAA